MTLAEEKEIYEKTVASIKAKSEAKKPVTEKETKGKVIWLLRYDTVWIFSVPSIQLRSNYPSGWLYLDVREIIIGRFVGVFELES